jgi:hypothetical protein
LDDVETEDVDFAFFFLKGSELRVDDGTEVVEVFAGGPTDPESKVVSSSDVSLRFDVEADMRVEASPSLSTSIASLLA